MKIRALLIALVLFAASAPGSANEDVIVEMERRLNADPELACRLSYRLMVKVLGHDSSPGSSESIPNIVLSPQHVYMKDCLALPRMVQKCLVDKYAYYRMEACQAARSRTQF